jgi:CcmD family protein
MDSNIIVMLVTLVIWIGIFVYMKRVDARVSELEK